MRRNGLRAFLIKNIPSVVFLNEKNIHAEDFNMNDVRYQKKKPLKNLKQNKHSNLY